MEAKRHCYPRYQFIRNRGSAGENKNDQLPLRFSIRVISPCFVTCFAIGFRNKTRQRKGFLAQGLQRTSAGLGSVIIDTQPLTVAVLASFLFGESIGIVRAGGLLLSVAGLLLLEVPSVTSDGTNFSLWGSGEWWMLLTAQSMAIGTVMVRWVSKYSDTIMATGWHMIIGGLSLLAVSIINHDPVFSGSLQDLSTNDVIALLYTSIFGSAVSYGVYFYSATKGGYMAWICEIKTIQIDLLDFGWLLAIKIHQSVVAMMSSDF
ncbi:PREDICTED: WAT1-related protein At3g02690, chloroplastic-like [Camelina sativa]|uniref:WAT1-related protein At3g02690, chloroplastic-like n=1 Tax=Camelina sativa TaxID=90675 RepID=A0ABM0ZBQ2_CAMSA|nr:PREDICTED: WAT1-related protein At3g02690, chloroplastic-like [Camelina sativa]